MLWPVYIHFILSNTFKSSNFLLTFTWCFWFGNFTFYSLSTLLSSLSVSTRTNTFGHLELFLPLSHNSHFHWQLLPLSLIHSFISLSQVESAADSWAAFSGRGPTESSTGAGQQIWGCEFYTHTHTLSLHAHTHILVISALLEVTLIHKSARKQSNVHHFLSHLSFTPSLFHSLDFHYTCTRAPRSL